MSTLLTIKGYNMGVRYPLGDVTTIGRGDEYNIPLYDEGVSRGVHAEISRQRLAFTIFDKGSPNGVFVNGNRVDREKLLKRNDEIVIGSTHFLFDSDFDIKNTLFTNKSVYLSRPTDPTIYRTVDREQIETLDDYRRGGFELLEQISNLIASPETRLPAASEGILAGIVKLTGARNAALLRWDPVAREMIPLAAYGGPSQLAVNREIVAETFQERKAFLASDVTLDLRYAEDAGSPAAAGSVICVPVGTEAHCEGVIYADAQERDHFGLREVAMLLAAGRLVYLAIQFSRLHDRCETLAAAPAPMIGNCRAIRVIREQAARIAKYEAPILITGETGTGKELLAREIHSLSPRRDGPFVAINCSAIPETLFESELFGHEKGAFTGADQMKRGKIEVASGGTLFLDEIGEMNLAVQPKILRFLQDQTFYRVGGTRPIRCNVHIIAATNKDLRQMAEDGRFRADLMFRLNVIELHLPALRERRDDIPLLVDYFLKQLSAELTKPVEGITKEAVEYLAAYDWPGNIREMTNCLERAILLAKSPILDVADFTPILSSAPLLHRPRAAATGGESSTGIASFAGKSLAEVERTVILAALERNDWNQVQTAQELGIHRNTLRNKIQEYGLSRPTL